MPMRMPTEHAPELLAETGAEEHIDIDVNACTQSLSFRPLKQKSVIQLA